MTTASGLGTMVTPDGNLINITGGTRPGKGKNLFHSFENFSIGKDQIANFLNNKNLPTENILSRVTGGNPSDIMGTIKTTDPSQSFGDANFYLMNPQGIIFGPNAKLDIGGSFYATTANNIELKDGELFKALPNTNDATLLTSAAPEAFGFLTTNPKGITSKPGSILEVTDGHTIALVGGSIKVDSELNAPSGQIHLVSIAGTGQFTINNATAITTEFGEVSIDKNARLLTQGTFQSEDGGTVSIVGGKIQIKNAEILTNPLEGTPAIPGFIPSIPSFGKGGNVTVAATESINIEGSTIDTSSELSMGGGGTVDLMAPSIKLANNSEIKTSTFGDDNPDSLFGSSGDVLLNAGIQGSVTLMNSSIDTTSFDTHSGNAGNIFITGDTVLLNGGSTDASATGTANPGNITFSSDTLTLRDHKVTSSNLGSPGRSPTITVQGSNGVDSFASQVTIESGGQIQTFNNNPNPLAEGGLIEIYTENLKVVDGGSIDNNTRNNGRAGSIRITALEELSLIGESSNGESSKLSATSLSNTTTGGAGMVEVKTKNLIIRDGARIVTTNSGNGLGGKITVEGSEGNTAMAESVFISGESKDGKSSGIFTTSDGLGNGGDITIDAMRVGIRNGGSIGASSLSNSSDGGNAGNITVNAGDQIVLDHGSITTEALNASGGNITLRAPNLIHLINSEITSSVKGPPNSVGGNIDLDPQAIVLQASKILANATLGRGGAITLTGNVILQDPLSLVSATAGPAGINGSVNIQAPIQQLSETTSPLPEKFLLLARLFGQACAAQKHGVFSSFIKRNFDGIPPIQSLFRTSPLFATYEIGLTTGIKLSQKSGVEQNDAAFQPQISWSFQDFNAKASTCL